MSVGNRLFWVTRILILNILLSILVSWRLWFQFEGIPQVPVFDQIPALVPLAQKIITGLTIVYLLGVFLYPKSRLPIGLGLMLLLLVTIQDWNRIQPWLVQSFGMLVLLIPLQRLYRKYESLEYLQWAFRLSVVGFYFWTGAFKFNPAFNDYVIPYVVSPITNILTNFKSEVYAISSVFPFLEIIFAFGLLIPKVSKFSVFGLIGFHLIILGLLGPFGLNTYPIIWIWNAAMIGLLWVGIGTAQPKFSIKFWYKTKRTTWVALSVFTVLPFLNVYNYYNKSTAFEIYSGTNYVANLKLPLDEISEINSMVEPFSYKFQDSLHINTHELFQAEYNAPPNPDPKVITKLEEKFKQKMR